MANARIPLSAIPRDPVVAAFLKRGEDENGQFAVPARPKPVLVGGAAKALETA